MEEKWVECVNAEFHCGSLTRGKKYRVVSIDCGCARIVDDTGTQQTYYSHRFKPATPPEPKSNPPEVSCVRCYKNDGYEGSLTVGRLYEVVACPLGFRHVGRGTHILDDNGKFCWYDNAHFVEPPPAQKAEEPERWVRCVNKEGYFELTVGRVYKVIPDPDNEKKGYIRVVNDRGSDVSYYSSRFEDAPPPSRPIEEIARDIVETFDDGLGATCHGMDPFLGVSAKTELVKLLTELAYTVGRNSMKAIQATSGR